jgi:signal peptidase
MKRLEEKTTAADRVLTLIGVVLCIILIPILAVNVTLIVKSYTDADEVPHVGGYSPLIVLTGSMEPQISSGDLIVVKRIDGESVQVGDVVAFFDPESTTNAVLTHRVTEVVDDDGTLSFRTKGDANDTEDTLLVPSSSIVGIYQTRFGGLGNVAMFMQTTTGLVVCVVLPLILLVGYDVIRQRHFEKANRQDTEALLAELAELKAQRDADGRREALDEASPK